MAGAVSEESAERVADFVLVGAPVDDTEGDHVGVLLALIDAQVLADCAPLLQAESVAEPEPLSVSSEEELAEGAALLLA